MYICLHGSTHHSYKNITKLEFSGQILEKSYSINFQENPSSGSRVIPCGRTEEQTDRQQTDMQTGRI
jgi:hypothetical protein